MYLAAAIAPLRNSKGEIVAVVESDILMPHIQSSAVNLIALSTLLYMFIIMVITMVVFYTFVRRRIIGPLDKTEHCYRLR